MASLFRKPTTITDPVTGKKVTTKSKKWWGQYKDADGIVRRKSLSSDRMAAQAMLNELVKRVEREKAGLVDPTEEQRKRPLSTHLAEFVAYLKNKENSPRQVSGAESKLKRIIDDRQWRLIGDISASGLMEFLGKLRAGGLSAQTYNSYLGVMKHFTHWLVRDHRSNTNPLTHLAPINIRIDRRHDRRPLSSDEFTRLLEAARGGEQVEGISGCDREMLYILAAWTGLRKGEIGSLTFNSLRLDDSPPTVTVGAAYSKHRREDVFVLHPELVEQLRKWLKTRKRLGTKTPLFLISRCVPGGIERKTSKMIERDLMVARDKWLEEATIEEEQEERLKSDFLCYCNHDGRFADFHSLRHLFITRLGKAGIAPKMAQTLARHCDIRLTMGIYSHVTMQEQTTAIESLPGLAEKKDGDEADAA